MPRAARLALAIPLLAALLLAPGVGAQEQGGAEEPAAPKGPVRPIVPGQREDGSWPGNPDGGFSDTAATGLALLAHLGMGYTHKHGKYRDAVRAGLLSLKQGQRKGGCFVDPAEPNAVRDHAIAALAMAEAYSLTQSPIFKQLATDGAAWLREARRPDRAWGFSVDAEEPALEPTVFAVLALESARNGGLLSDPAHESAARALVGGLADPAPRDAAMGALILLVLGDDPRKEGDLQALLSVLATNLPVWDERPEAARVFGSLYWALGTMACFQAGGDTWKSWNAALKPAIIDHQIREGERKGGWELAGAWAKRAGAAANHSLLMMCMSVYYRYSRVFGTPDGQLPPSTGGTTEPNDNPYGDVFFRHYGVNPFVDTEDDPKSTFAMDVDTISEARRVFLENLTGTLQTVARDAKVQIEFDPAVVTRYRLLGYENRDVKDSDFRGDVDAGEVGAGQSVTALYEVKLAKNAPEGRPLGTFRIRYRPAAADEKTIEEAVPVARAILDAEPSRGLCIQAAAAEFAEILRGSYWARDGSLAKVRDDLAALLANGDADPRERELLDLVTRAAGLKPQAGDAPAPEERPRLSDGE